MKVIITKCFSFCYGHNLPGHKGKCKNFHGHNAQLEVTVSNCSGYVNDVGIFSDMYIEELKRRGDYPGMVFDFGDLKKVVQPFIERVDHRDLNELMSDGTVDFIEDAPTAECMAIWFFNSLKDALPDYIHVEKIKISETPDSWAEVVR